MAADTEDDGYESRHTQRPMLSRVSPKLPHGVPSVRFTAALVAVAFLLSTAVVVLVTEEIVVLLGMPVPDIARPASVDRNFAVALVTVLEPDVVAAGKTRPEQPVDAAR